MKVKPVQKNTKNMNSNEALKDDEFINIINILLDSIKEYYKVTKNINKNEFIIINSVKKVMNNFEQVFKDFFSKNINDNKELKTPKDIIEKINNNLNNLELNINSNEKNLVFFFEDAKVLFKKMKEERQEIISRMKKRTNSFLSQRLPNNNANNKDNFNNCYSQSEIQLIATVPNENYVNNPNYDKNRKNKIYDDRERERD